ncbi:MAG: hypothetical protein JWN51_792 [Phycisphaerales bacterium]|nr:hypothetical protein [Phycisphaerales bacterium]
MVSKWLIVWLVAMVLPALLAFLNRWVWVPIRMHSRQTILIRPRREATASEQLTPELQDYIGQVVRQFRDIGFEVAGNFHQPGAVPGINSFQIVCVNRATNDLAIIIATRGSNSRSMLFAIRSEFPDGTWIATANNRGIGIFPREPGTEVANFSWAKDPAELHEAHRRLLRRAGKSNTPRIAPAPGEALAYVDREWDRNSHWHVRCGYRWRDDSAGVYRFTWKGAYFSTWKLLWPLKGWRLRLRDYKARRLWNELGMDQWHRPASAAVLRSPPPRPLPGATGTLNAPVETTSNTRAGTLLRYEGGLAEGEIRSEQVDGALVVRAGGITVGRVILRRWGNLLLILILTVPVVSTSLLVWRMPKYLYRSLYGIWVLPAFWVVLIAIEILALTRALRQARGTAVITASQAGLRFTNAPDHRGNGEIAREDIGSLFVLIDRAGLRGKWYRLEARPFHSGPTQVLIRSKDLIALNEVQRAMAVALGIESEQLAETVG